METREKAFLRITAADKNIYDAVYEHNRYIKNNDLVSQPYGWIPDMKSAMKGGVENYNYLYTKVPESDHTNFNIEKGNYLVAYHSDKYSMINQTYNRMFQYSKNFNITLKGFFYEDILLDE